MVLTTLYVIAALLLLLMLVLLVRTATFRSEDSRKAGKGSSKGGVPSALSESPAVKVDLDRATESLARMIRCRTISRYRKEEEEREQFEAFRALLQERYPALHTRCELHRIGDDGLLYRWPGKSSEGPTILMAHYDVVPVNEELWSKPPFGGIVEDGVLWGRGTLDTKITLCGALEAAEGLISSGFQPERDIYFSFGGDEEIAGDDAPSIVRFLEEHGVRPALVLDEGGAVVEGVFPGVESPCALVGIGEKGIMDLEFSLSGQGGHASAPPPHTLLGEMSRFAVEIEKRPFPGRLSPAAAKMFDTLGRHSTFLYRMIFANLWLFRPLLDLICRKSGGELNALMRTTCALTMAEGSSAPNVLPPKVKMVANLRIISGESTDSAEAYLKQLASRVLDRKLTLQCRRIEGSNPSPISDTECEGWRRVERAIAATWPGAIISPYLMIAASDARHFHRISDRVFRFSVLELSKEERALIHGNDERIPVEKIGRCVEFYSRLIGSC